MCPLWQLKCHQDSTLDFDKACYFGPIRASIVPAYFVDFYVFLGKELSTSLLISLSRASAIFIYLFLFYYFYFP